MKATKGKTRRGEADSGAPATPHLAARVTELERQLAELRGLRSIKHDLAHEAHLAQQKRDAERHAQHMREIARQRVEHMRRFVSERLALHADLSVSPQRLLASYKRWAEAAGVDTLERAQTQDELLDALAQLLPADVQWGETGERNTVGRHQPGLLGVGLAAEGQTPRALLDEVTGAAAARKAEDAARERRLQREADAQEAVVNAWALRQKAYAQLAQMHDAEQAATK